MICDREKGKMQRKENEPDDGAVVLERIPVF
jgi:hypothetical protein